MIPGLQDAVFLRYGVMHRNTFVDAPRALDSTLAVKNLPRVRMAGQVTGTEGYCEAAASGLLAALNTYADMQGAPVAVLPADTALGALLGYATDPDTGHYEPMHVNFGIVPPLATPIRAQRAMAEWVASRQDLFGDEVTRG
jgi:methylenetetrahydrofolate--tRNA-(uracil-5-)-methyltransferase